MSRKKCDISVISFFGIMMTGSKEMEILTGRGYIKKGAIR